MLFHDFVVWVRHCVVRRFVWRCLIFCLVTMSFWFLLKDRIQSITDSINDLSVNIVYLKASVFSSLRFYHIILRYITVIW